MVKVRILPWDGQVEGLGPAATMPLWDDRLGDCVRRAVSAAGFQVVDGDADLVVEEGTALGPDALSAAADEGRRLGRPVRLRLGGETGRLLDEIALGGSSAAIGWQGGQEEVELDPKERVIALDAGPAPLSDRLALRVRHPVQLLWANLLGMPAVLWRRIGPLRAFAAALGLAPNRIGRGARVHRSAVVEGCVLGDGAEVGAGAVVRGCILGSRARVEELADCEGAVLGASAVVQRQALCRFSVLGDGAMLGGCVQLAVMGEGASLKRGSYGMDQGLDREVRVAVGGGLVRAPRGLMGVVVGHRTLVGSGVWIGPGRVIPPDLQVLGPDPLVHPGAEGGAGAYSVRNGRLERLR